MPDNINHKCIFCEEPNTAVWKVKGTEKLVCEKHKTLLSKETELIWIESIGKK